MRLLANSKDGGFTLHKFKHGDNIPPYAALSHTWLEDNSEVTYHDLVSDVGKSKAGYDKLYFCGAKAATDGLDYFWVDTCCINKDDVAEISASINSMFRWYQRATKCYAYLSDVYVPDEVPDESVVQMSWEEAFRRSRWFTRGWTLQELIAPDTVEFFSANGKLLGSKITLEKLIQEITKIPTSALLKFDPEEFEFEERLRWIWRRNTAVEEDIIYCLLGIFDVSLPLIYGEGAKSALMRLRDTFEGYRRQLAPEKAKLSTPGRFCFSFMLRCVQKFSHSVQHLQYSHS